MKFIKVEDFEKDSSIKIVSLNRPGIKNAFHPEMISEITSIFLSAHSENNLKLIVLKGEGTVFCAGADINWMKDMINYTLEQNLADSAILWEMFQAIQTCRTPVIGIAHGAVFGGALGLLSCCDYVFAEEKTKFCFSEVKLGLAPAIISGFISRKISDAFYRPYMLSAEIFTASDAKNMGLIHKIYSGSIELSEITNKFSANGVEAMRETKVLLNSLLSQKSQKELCARVISERRMSQEGQERMKKFL